MAGTRSPGKGFIKPDPPSFRERISRFGWRTVVGSIILGVTGNAVFAILSLLPHYREQIALFLVRTPLFGVVVYATLVGFFGIFWQVSKRKWGRRYAESRQNEMFILNSLDDSLLRLLPGLVTTDKHNGSQNGHVLDRRGQELDDRMDRLITAFLEHANTMVFSEQARRGLLFCPDEKKESLVLRYKSGWADNLNQIIFRIDEGVVGEAYQRAETIVARRKHLNGQYRWDRDTYVPHSDARGPLQHNAVICVPVTGTSDGSGRGDILAVVCFDSRNPDLFDAPEVIETLEKFARHLATSLLIYRKLSQACSVSSCVFARPKEK
jgi:hypothetical protein